MSQRLPGQLAFCVGLVANVFQRTAALDGGHNICKAGGILVEDGSAYQLPVFGRAVLQHINQGQGGFAFREVIANVFAKFGSVAAIIKRIVDQLEGHTEMMAITSHLRDGLVVYTRDHGTKLGRGFKQFGSLEVDHLQIPFFSGIGIASVHQL